MKRQNFTLNSHDHITKLHGMMWKPEKEVRAVVQLVHGMIEYVERYDAFASWLAERGIFVIGHDHLGHGDSVVCRDDWGFFEEENGNRVLLEDMHQVRLRVQEKFPDVPYLIVGHSMGSFLTRQYLCLHGEGIHAAVILGTGDMPAGLLRFGMFLTSSMASVRGWRYRSRLVKLIVFGTYNKRIHPHRTDSDWISRDEAIVDAYKKEPRTSFDFTLNGYYNLFYSMYCLKNRDYLERMPTDFPILLAAGAEDPVGSYGEGVRRVQKELLALGVKQVDLKLDPDDRHELLNELDREQVFEDIGGWILQTLDNGQKEWER